MPIVLYQFPPVPGLPSMSPFCVKVQMAFKRKGVDFEVVNTLFAKRHNPRGKLPFVVWEGETLEDSTAIIQAIDQRGTGPSLVPEDPRLAADAHILEDWADESLFWYAVYARYADPEGWSQYRPQVAAVMPAAMRPLAPGVIRRSLVKKLQAHGLLTRSPELVRAEFEHHMGALSARLESGPYLLGDALCMADVAVAAMLLPHTVGIRSRFQPAIEAHPALAGYVARVCAETGIDAAA
jgi:glutathione S-transferase